ncbi:MAG: cobyric acid synthase, partial [Clostridia bacterium]
ITAGLCRVFCQDGYKVAPFKSQNMALNSFITVKGGEMSRAQVVQAQACKVEPDIRMNPILLKPTSDVGSQVILNGKSIGNYSAVDYFKMKKSLIPEIKKAYDDLANENDIIVIEGAGSPAEINLKADDIVNMGIAKLVNSPVLLVGDIDRGGVFAQLYGTIELLEPAEQELIKGVIVNKFRGDREILKDGLQMLENITKKPVIGVCPYIKIDLEDEDSMSERLNSGKNTKAIDIAVIKTPHLANFSDFDVFGRFENVSLRYVEKVNELQNPDLIILGGSKSTIADFKWLQSSGMELAIQKLVDKDAVLFGICGGYQMLGSRIIDDKNVETGGSVDAMGYFDMTTRFELEKTTKQDSGTFQNVGGIFSNLNGIEYKGYEIHQGKSDVEKVLNEKDNVYGTYMHGVFDADKVAETILKSLAKRKNITVDFETINGAEYKETQFDKLADMIRNSLDMKKVYEILGIKNKID